MDFFQIVPLICNLKLLNNCKVIYNIDNNLIQKTQRETDHTGITGNSHGCLAWTTHFIPDAEMESVGVLINYKSELSKTDGTTGKILLL